MKNARERSQKKIIKTPTHGKTNQTAQITQSARSTSGCIKKNQKARK
jgi:hypothetical protein